jgi:hypothetical protein
MRLSIYTSKGGQGKTPLSVMFNVDHGFAIGCNESTDIYAKHLNPDMYLLHKMDQAFPQIPDDINIVFDMAGTLTEYDHALVSALRQSDVVIVPISNCEVSKDLGANTIRAISDITKRIVVVATHLERNNEQGVPWTETADFKEVFDVVSGIDNTIKVLPLKYSRVFKKRIYKEFTSIHKLVEDRRIVKTGQLEILAQIEDIYKEVGLSC